MARNTTLSSLIPGPWAQRVNPAMGLPRRQITALTAVIFMIAALGCGGHSYKIPSDSYVITGRNYTYAIYNNEHRLMTHPLEDLLFQIRERQKTEQPQVTDVYVVSHGWNFTPDSAVANYHNYIELVDYCFSNKVRKGNIILEPQKTKHCQSFEKGFQPYFIFVTWISTTRPTAELASAVLPFDLDGAIRPITYIVDNVPLHLVTAWKQSLNAAANALGNAYPQTYVSKPVWWPDCTKKYWTDAFYVEEKLMGQDVPVSSLLFELIWAKEALMLKKPDQSRLLECFMKRNAGQEEPLRKSLGNIRIHLLGHSYGAKLIAFSGMEALRRLVLRHKLGLTDDGIDPSSNGTEEEQARARKEYENEMERILDETGHKGYSELPFNPGLYYPDEIRAAQAFDRYAAEVLDKTGDSLIESLIMINPALHPGEFWYPVDSLHNAPASTLRLIPRKAIVYSKYDYANGTLFNIREAIINTQIAQYFHSAQAHFANRTAHWYFPLNAFSDVIVGSISGVGSLVSSVLRGTLLYAGTTIINMPYDLFYHVTENDFGGRWEKKPIDSGVWMGIGKGFVNFVDYFIPTYPLSFGWLDRNEDQQGLYRLARPALGKTGLYKIAVGRPEGVNLWGLRAFSKDSTDIPAETFCKFSEGILPNVNQVDAQSTRQNIYSFDASLVYDKKLSADGAHSDVRSREEASCKASDDNPDPTKNEKRAFSFRFIYNFSKTNFVNALAAGSDKTDLAASRDVIE